MVNNCLLIILNYFSIIIFYSFIVKAEVKNSALLSWSLENKGFHRNIRYKLEIQDNNTCKEYQTIIKQVIPSSLYVNKDQLEDLSRLGKVTAIVNDFIDIEQPEDVSTSHDVLLFGSFEETAQYTVSSNIYLPVHLRYHLPQVGGGFRSTILPLPKVYVKPCEFSSNSTSKDVTMLPCSADSIKSCLYHLLPYKINDDTLEVLIPVGNSDHYDIVLIITHLITIGGALYIYTVVLLSLPKSSNSKKS
ncbi:hypothetical protein O3M35_008617 [Rhynocoris fuscipes]|uniref:Phosphatidylinositol-glycan biosynthesis class X protein n=1 Tax=Rhynocoris fuscipes TaxID=488301 RepID=A0AAW1DAD8_9HEMI